VYAALSFLQAWMTVWAWRFGAQWAALHNAAFAPALFACMLTHAFARALTARRYGIKTPGLALVPILSPAGLERMTAKPHTQK